jgi:hypothetical protein
MTRESIARICGAITVALACGANLAFAGPANGIGFYGGVIGASQAGVQSKGLSLGVDAQFMVNDNWSVNPYLMASAERDPDSTSLADGLAGVQLRRWFGDWFVGGHMFEHDLITFRDGRVSSSAYGLAFGPVAGFENAAGWGAAIQLDAFESTIEKGVRRNAVRLHLTHRWY